MQRKLILTVIFLLLGGSYLVYRIVRWRSAHNLAVQTKQAYTPNVVLTGPTPDELQALAEQLVSRKIQLRAYQRVLAPADVHQHGLITDAVFTSDTTLDHEAIELLKKLPDLKACSFYDTPLTDEQLELITELESLQSLNLNYTQVTDEGMPIVAKLQHLKTLLLNGDAITDDGLKPLRELPSLNSLGLFKTNISDNGLKILASCEGLRSIDIQATGVSPAAVQELQQQLPDCTILADPY